MVDRFVSEKDLEEAKKKRQEEWEKVRKPTDPEEVPEEEVDSRPLYDRLKEVRDRKQAEYEEEHKLKNMIRGLDMEECDFLSRVDDLKAKEDLEKNKEEKALLSEIDRARARTNVEENMPSVSNFRVKPTNGIAPKQSKQAAILRAAVKRKSDVEVEKCVEKRPAPTAMSSSLSYPSACKVIDVLPGMADYASSSNSESDQQSCGEFSSLVFSNSNSDSNVDSDSDSSSELPILPVLIQTLPEKEDKTKQLSDSDSE